VRGTGVAESTPLRSPGSPVDSVVLRYLRRSAGDKKRRYKTARRKATSTIGPGKEDSNQENRCEESRYPDKGGDKDRGSEGKREKEGPEEKGPGENLRNLPHIPHIVRIRMVRIQG